MVGAGSFLVGTGSLGGVARSIICGRGVAGASGGKGGDGFCRIGTCSGSDDGGGTSASGGGISEGGGTGSLGGVARSIICGRGVAGASAGKGGDGFCRIGTCSGSDDGGGIIGIGERLGVINTKAGRDAPTNRISSVSCSPTRRFSGQSFSPCDG